MLPSFEKGLFSFITSVYRNSVFIGLYTSWDSFVSKSRKVNLVKYLTHQALMIYSKSRIGVEIK